MLCQIVLFDGFDPLDVIAPYEVLFAGSMAAPGALTVELVSAEGPREVPSGSGLLALRATARLDPQRADLVLVPGAVGPLGTPDEGADTADPDAPGSRDTLPALLARTVTTGLPALLKEALDRPDSIVATVCGGSMVLAMAGLIEGRHATTNRLGLDLLGAAGVVAIDARVVDDGDLVSGAGVTSGLDLGLHLLERELGPRIAHAVEQLFAHERRGTVWRATGPVPAAF
ncbi:DJ-1/PfpI family protein [Streptomyces vinaceus]|uniref:DJ-1/PfpI family protein n=1 Tax=Streptomyces vinaceus TaxID=1960 RepID=UPI0035D5DA49